MAGIGFLLRNSIKKEDFSSILKAYTYASILSAGPWMSTILAILAIGFLDIFTVGNKSDIIIYQLIITYTFALSSIFTSFIQLPFTRYVADLIYKNREDLVLPSYLAVLAFISLISLIVLLPLSIYIFPEQSPLFRYLVVYIFIIMMDLWIANVIASSLKYYKNIFLAYITTYMLIALFTYLWGDSIEKMLFIFLSGNFLLFLMLSIFIILNYPSKRLLFFEFFTKGQFYWFLGFSALFYTLAIWIDKFIFWFYPYTGSQILGKLNMSIVYDIPIFMAYLTIAPGMALFFFRIEAYFSQKYEKYYDSVTLGGDLGSIKKYKKEMVDVIRYALRDIIVLQTIISIFIYIYTPEIFSTFHIPLLYSSLFHIDMVGAQLQLGFMSVLALLYYLDKRRVTMWLSLTFLILNGLLTLLSIYLGPYYFGYGYALSLLIVFVISLWILQKTMEDLEYETFLLR